MQLRAGSGITICFPSFSMLRNQLPGISPKLSRHLRDFAFSSSQILRTRSPRHWSYRPLSPTTRFLLFRSSRKAKIRSQCSTTFGLSYDKWVLPPVSYPSADRECARGFASSESGKGNDVVMADLLEEGRQRRIPACRRNWLTCSSLSAHLRRGPASNVFPCSITGQQRRTIQLSDH